jgi:hypothetical protein
MTAKKTQTKTKADPFILLPMRGALEGIRKRWGALTSFSLADELDAALRSAIRATIPGRQQKKNLEPLLKTARAAFVRTLRRRARG